MKQYKYILMQVLLVLGLALAGCSNQVPEEIPQEQVQSASPQVETPKETIADDKEKIDSTKEPSQAIPQRISLNELPEFSESPYVVVDNNEPQFSQADFTTQSVERYAPLDELGRCGVAFANIGKDLMPTEERGSIGQVKPSGWQTIKYDQVDGKYLYNRCHLIGYQLTAENANKENLITGTRYLNMEGMLPFENMVADYIKETNNHVLYRVTPIYEGEELVARGVNMEAISVEDQGEGICFNVFVYNNQPGIVIDYKTGESSLSDTEATVNDSQIKEETIEQQEQAVKQEENEKPVEEVTYVINTNTHKFHKPSCSSAKKINDENKDTSSGDRETLINQGYEPCKNCNP